MTQLDELEAQGFLVGYSENALIIYPDKTGKATITYQTTPPALFIFWLGGGYKEIIVEFNISEMVTGLNSTQTYRAAAGVGLSRVIVYVYNPLEFLINLTSMMMVLQTLLNALGGLG
mgnify:CR=1 FL=1